MISLSATTRLSSSLRNITISNASLLITRQQAMFSTRSALRLRRVTEALPRRQPTKPVFLNYLPSRQFSAAVEQSIGLKLIPLVNKLQEVFSLVNLKLDLPQIVVIGSQSSGKSSVLESLVGRDFLPRGSGIVTRRPLILQLHKTEKGAAWGEFAHMPEKKFFQFTEIRSEIDRATEQLCGANKGISDVPIILRVYSPSVLPLTLVDTPGIARIPVGDQPSDIEERIRNMVVNYVSNPNSIILAVQAANQDLATSDALKIARSVDPEGQRTVGVLTKLDLMDRGTDASDILTGKLFPLKLGFIGIVNRSQYDIQTNKGIDESIEDESKFFHQHNIYRSFLHQCGTKNLAIKCNLLLTEHIQKCLPSVKETIRDRLKDIKKQISIYGERPVEAVSQGWVLLQLINKLCDEVGKIIQGTPSDILSDHLTGGARIRYVFNQIYSQKLNMIKPTENITSEQYRIAIKNASGIRPSLFVPEAAFELLVKNQLEKLRDPSLQCAEMVSSEILRIINDLCSNEIAQYQNLNKMVMDISTDYVRKCLTDTNRMINDVVELEKAFMNTSHPDFTSAISLLAQHYQAEQNPAGSVGQGREREDKEISGGSGGGGGGGIFSAIFGRRDRSQKDEERKVKEEPLPDVTTMESLSKLVLDQLPSDIRLTDPVTAREKVQINLLKGLIESYFRLASKQIGDVVVKSIWHFLVNKIRFNLQKELLRAIYKEDLFANLFAENKEVADTRKQLKKDHDALRRAKHILMAAEVVDLPSPVDDELA